MENLTRAIQILRIEKSYRSYGTDMDINSNPYEVGLQWVVCLDKSDFIGKEALIKIKNESVEKKLIGFNVLIDTPLNKGDLIFNQLGEEVGYITSYCDSPTLRKKIAMGIVKRSEIKQNILFKNKQGIDFIQETKIPFYDAQGIALKQKL